jgi:hypothetical protein
MRSTFSFLVIALMLVIPLCGKSQELSGPLPVDPDTRLITYKEVVHIDGTKTELFNRAIAWINKEYKNPVDVTKVRNPESGLIEILHRIEISSKEPGGVKKPAGLVDYTLRIELKEGRYRYTITNFTHKEASRFPIEKWMDKKDPSYNALSGQFMVQINDFIQKLIGSLKEGMLPPVAPKKDEW